MAAVAAAVVAAAVAAVDAGAEHLMGRLPERGRMSGAG